MITDKWTGCYPSRWKGLIVEDAITHPAKFSSRLISRIYQHMLDEGWLRPGDVVLDPFGGVALGALDAMRHGLRWRGVELEPRFAELGNANIAHWNARFSRMPHWSGDAVLYQGDSRRLLAIVDRAGSAISSPPYETGGHHKHKMDAWNTNGGGQFDRAHSGYGAGDDMGISASVSSPPYADSMEKPNGIDASKFDPKHHAGKHSQANMDPRYSAAGAVSSPPYAEARIGQESGQGNCGRGDQYGATAGQLGAMRAEGFEAAISSPPFAAQMNSGGGDVTNIYRKMCETTGRNPNLPRVQVMNSSHQWGENPDNMGNQTGDEFWTAARTIVEQVYAALEPGGHAAWVCKDFVKDKQIVPFCDQWRQLCEAVGFVTLHEHHAMLTRHNGTSHTLEGGTVEHITESKSFFRRLAEKHGSPRIDYETVYCMVKP